MTGSKRTATVAALVGVMMSGACSESGPTSPSPTAPGETVALEGGSRMTLSDGGRLSEHRPAVQRLVRETVSRVRPLIPVDGVTIAVLAGSDVILELGFGGFADRGHTVRLTFDPASPALAASLETALVPVLAHELHHIARQRTIGYGDTLLAAMVSEGLADHFSLEVAGGDPPLWAVALTGGPLADWTARARDVWLETGYDHDAWFFGTGAAPRWAGYAIGYAITGRYLRAHPSRRASELHAEPAASFLAFGGT